LKIIQNEMVRILYIVWIGGDLTCDERTPLNLVEEIIAKEGIDCDFWRGFTYGA
jgi:hypothetical protein